MGRVKGAVGRFGEQLAARHLEAAGLQILDRNWRCPEGEIDIVAADCARGSLRRLAPTLLTMLERPAVGVPR